MQKKYRLVLFGPLQLFGPDGSERTPRLAKAQALLAILAMARGRPCHRASLQDKLWSDRGPLQGRDSLKKALAEIRHAFGTDADRMLKTQGGPVQLDLGDISVDVFEPEAQTADAPVLRPEFLEGLDIRDPQFDLWLQEARQALSGDGNAAGAAAYGPGTQRMRFSLGILPVDAVTGQGVPLLLSNVILGRITTALRHYDIFDVYDFREEPRAVTRNVDVTLRLRALLLDDVIVTDLSLRRVSDNEVIWGHERSFDSRALSSSRLSSVVMEIVDQMSSALFRQSALGDPSAHFAARHALDGIDQIFRLSARNVDDASKALRRAVELDPRSSYLAWCAYLLNFRLEETKGRNVKELREHADDLARRALDSDPFNPLTRSLLTHVYSFLFRDFERAACLIDPLMSNEPDLPLYHHSLAMLRFYTGDIEGARSAARKCHLSGRFHPYGYAFATAMTQIDVVAGDYAAAIRHGEEAMALQRSGERKFQPTLRYLGVAYAETGDSQNARRIWGLLQNQDPGFSHENIDDERFPVPSREVRTLLRSGLRKLGHMSH